MKCMVISGLNPLIDDVLRKLFESKGEQLEFALNEYMGTTFSSEPTEPNVGQSVVYARISILLSTSGSTLRI